MVSYSTDGVNWITNANAFAGTKFASSIATNGTNFAIVGQGTSDTIMTSTNGYTFTGLGKTVFTTTGYSVCYSPFKAVWAALGEITNTIAYSTNNTVWIGDGTSVFTAIFSGAGYTVGSCAGYYNLSQSPS